MTETIEIKHDNKVGIDNHSEFSLKVMDAILKLNSDTLEKYTGEILEEEFYNSDESYSNYLSKFGIVMEKENYTVTYLKDDNIILSYTFSELQTTQNYYKYVILVERM